ncbi:MAG: Amidophosphoribosyltransferase [Thermotoga petrophila]|uniref:Amidophosphoribosyltransferase n=1 Tax=Thermotoga petrophila TaxID=93929 RepID=A0A101EPU6_9THEM|nr:MAG: Amidophosphoribosyltransferase [Thermotoga petrophila]
MLKEACGVAGVWNIERAYNILHDILLGLQHRGQESVGVVVGNFEVVKGMGLVEEIIKPERFLPGDRGIGHVRYSTVGSSAHRNIQPIIAQTRKGLMGVAHNGTLPDADYWKNWLMEMGHIFLTETDSELFLHLISSSPFERAQDAIVWTLQQIKCAYSLILYHKDFIAIARDGFGIRPLFWGRFENGFVMASEDAALRVIGAEDINEVAPGTVVFFEKDREPYAIKFSSFPKRVCSFEYIYFARPDSTFDGLNIHKARFNMGKILYEESKLEGDIVVPVLDSGISGALGFSYASGIPIDLGLMRNRYLGRSFIMPSKRSETVRRKLLPIPEVVSGKRVIVIDDSIVRGTTMNVIVKMLRESGAKEVYVAIHSPPVRFSCFYGIDTARRGELVASSHSVEELKETVGADNLIYLSIDGLKRALEGRNACFACFEGRYPHEENSCIGVGERNEL